MSGYCERCGETAACCCHADKGVKQARTMVIGAGPDVSPLEVGRWHSDAAYKELLAANAEQARRITELEEEREALEKQEPVCYRYDHILKIGNPAVFCDVRKFDLDNFKRTSAYTHPVPARTLTNEDIANMQSQYLHIESNVVRGYIDFARAIERHLKGD